MYADSVKKLTISISSIDNIYEFVRRASKVEGKVLCSRGEFCVDGKSILGLVSLNPSEPFDVTFEMKNPEEVYFNDWMDEFRI